MAVYDIDGIRIDDSIPINTFVNVADFGAVGDGVTDDADAIQTALDRYRTGIIFFPTGTYLISKSLTVYSNQTVELNHSTILQGASINNLMMLYCSNDTTVYNGTHDTIIRNGTFDGGAYTGNNTLLAFCHAKNITIENCTFKNAYGAWHDFEINSSYNVKVINCDFEGSRKTDSNGEMLQIDAIDNGSTFPWSSNRGQIDNTVSKYIEVCDSIFHTNTVSPAIGNHSGVADEYISIHDNIFDGLTSTRGAINLQSATNVVIFANVFNGCTTGIGSSGATYYIHGNRFVGVTTAVSGTSSIAHGNMINGTYTA